MILRRIFLSLVCLIPAIAQSAPDVWKYEAQTKSHVDAGDFFGAVLVAKDGKVLYRKGFGMAQAEWDIANTPETKFRLGSITKQFTAVAVLDRKSVV